MKPVATHDHGGDFKGAMRHAYMLAAGGWVVKVYGKGGKWRLIVVGLGA